MYTHEDWTAAKVVEDLSDVPPTVAAAILAGVLRGIVERHPDALEVVVRSTAHPKQAQDDGA